MMYFSKEEYNNVVSSFLNDYHGQIIKMRDDDGKIFSYFIRCQANAKEKSTIVISLAFDIAYSKCGTKSINSKELKFYAMKHAMEKWKKVKMDSYITYQSILSDSFYEKLKLDIDVVRDFYNKCNLKREFNSEETAKYIHKCIKNIKKYYKNEEIDKFKLIFV